MIFGISMTTLSNFRNRLPQYGVKGRFERKNTTWKCSVSIVLYRINKLYIFFSPICFNCKYGLLFLNFKSRIAYDGWRHALHVNKNNWYQRLHCFSTFRCRIIVCFNVYYFWIFICKHIASPAQHIYSWCFHRTLILLTTQIARFLSPGSSLRLRAIRSLPWFLSESITLNIVLEQVISVLT